MSKSASGLVAYCIAQVGRPYWQGTCGEKATEDLFQRKKTENTTPNAYGQVRWDADDVALYESDYKTQLGLKVHDCNGLIKGYFWTDSPDAFRTQYKINGMDDMSVEEMYYESSTKGKLSDIDINSLLPGTLLFKEPIGTHVGVYIGNGEVVESANHKVGVIRNKVKDRSFVYYGMLTSNIDYDLSADFVPLANPITDVPIEYDTAYIAPYVVMLDQDHSINYKNASKNGVFGCIFEAGKLWDVHHTRQDQFRNPNLDKQITGCLEARMQFGLYLKTYARTEFEAREELYQLSFILAKYQPALGMWINIMSYSKSNKDRNNKLIDIYKTRLWESGLKENIGLYAKENIYDIIDWEDKSKDWLLWVYKPVSTISDLDSNITPEFFKV